MPDSIFKFDENKFKNISTYFFKRLVADQYKFWFGFGCATLLFILRGWIKLLEYFEDVERVLDQVFSDNPELAEKWLDRAYCQKCPYYNKYQKEGI